MSKRSLNHRAASGPPPWAASARARSTQFRYQHRSIKQLLSETVIPGIVIEGTAILAAWGLSIGANSAGSGINLTMVQAILSLLSAMTVLFYVMYTDDPEQDRFFANTVAGFRVGAHRWLRFVVTTLSGMLLLAPLALIFRSASTLYWFLTASALLLPIYLVAVKALPVVELTLPVAACAIMLVNRTLPAVLITVIALTAVTGAQTLHARDRARYHLRTTRRITSHSSSGWRLNARLALAIMVWLEPHIPGLWFVCGLLVSLAALDQFALNAIAGQHAELATLRREGMNIAILLRKQLMPIAAVCVGLPSLFAAAASALRPSVSVMEALAGAVGACFMYLIGFALAVRLSVRYRGRPSGMYAIPQHVALIFAGTYLVIVIAAVLALPSVVALVLVLPAATVSSYRARAAVRAYCAVKEIR